MADFPPLEARDIPFSFLDTADKLDEFNALVLGDIELQGLFSGQGKELRTFQVIFSRHIFPPLPCRGNATAPRRKCLRSAECGTPPG